MAALLLCVVAGSCSQAELLVDHGDTLPPGKYPLLLTASIDQMTTRAAKTDLWGDGDVIAVQIEDYPVAGSYTLNADGSVKESEQPLSWPFENGKVKAWYPYVAVGHTIEKSIADQSKGYHDIDFLYAATENAENYKNTVNLRFSHLMAKVGCRLTRGEGVTDEDLKTAKVSYRGNTSISFQEGNLTGSGDGWVLADSAHTALLVPQVVSEGNFIKVDITLTVNGNEINKTLTYSTSGLELKAGSHYIYNIAVRKDSLVAQSVTATWTDKGESGLAEVDTIRVKMPANMPDGCRKMLKFSNSVLNQEEYLKGAANCLLVKGNDFTISYPTTADTLVAFSIIKDSEVEKSTDTIILPTEEKEDDKNYDITFHLRSKEVSLEWDYLIFNPKVGDYYYSDGTWGKYLREHKTCIGIVVKGEEGQNEAGNEDWLGKDDVIRGYVWALNEETGCWYSKETIPNYNNKNIGNAVNYEGYARTKYLLDQLADGESAAKIAYNWETTHPEAKAPETSSGWYLPSEQMVRDIFNNTFRNNQVLLFNEINAKLFMLYEGGGTILGKKYWTTNMHASGNKNAKYAYRNALSQSPSSGYTGIGTTLYIRPMLTFTNPQRTQKSQNNE